MEKLVSDLLLLAKMEIKLPSKDDFKLIDVGMMLERIAKDAKELSGKKITKLIVKLINHD
jgi:hypothetical protein